MDGLARVLETASADRQVVVFTHDDRLQEARHLARRTRHVWSALSRACHHHTCELAPTAAELSGWFSVAGS